MSALALTDSELRIASAPPAEQRARHRSFQEKLARAAEALAESKRPAPKPVAINPEAMPAETDPPRRFILVEVEPDLVAYPSISKIVDAVAKFFHTAPIHICSQRRTLDVVRARQIVMYLCRELTPKSLPQIGRALGDKDHTTVMHGAKKIERLIRFDAELALHVATLEQIITGVQQ